MLRTATHLNSFTEYTTFVEIAQAINHIPTELFMFQNHEQTYVACKYKHPLTSPVTKLCLHTGLIRLG